MCFWSKLDGMGNPVTLQYPGRPDSSMVEHLVQFQKDLGSSPGPVTFHAALGYGTRWQNVFNAELSEIKWKQLPHMVGQHDVRPSSTTSLAHC